MRKFLVALAAVALIGGCMKVDKNPPKEMPAYVHLYPGSTPMMNMNVMGMQAVALQTTDSPDTVMTYYRSQASADGLPEVESKQAAPSADQKQATFGNPASGRFLVVMAKPQGAGTVVSLTYKPAPKATS
jgi:hypothetical protein